MPPPFRGLSRRVRELKAKGVEFTRDIVVYDYGHDDRPMLGATVARFGFARSNWCTGFSGFPYASINLLLTATSYLHGAAIYQEHP